MKDERDMLDPGTGILLTPCYHGQGCLGNGDNPGYECCCDECDFYLECFPEWNFEDDLGMMKEIKT